MTKRRKLVSPCNRLNNAIISNLSRPGWTKGMDFVSEQDRHAFLNCHEVEIGKGKHEGSYRLTAIGVMRQELFATRRRDTLELREIQTERHHLESTNDLLMLLICAGSNAEHPLGGWFINGETVLIEDDNIRLHFILSGYRDKLSLIRLGKDQPDRLRPPSNRIVRAWQGLAEKYPRLGASPPTMARAA